MSKLRTSNNVKGKRNDNPSEGVNNGTTAADAANFEKVIKQGQKIAGAIVGMLSLTTPEPERVRPYTPVGNRERALNEAGLLDHLVHLLRECRQCGTVFLVLQYSRPNGGQLLSSLSAHWNQSCPQCAVMPQLDANGNKGSIAPEPEPVEVETRPTKYKGKNGVILAGHKYSNEEVIKIVGHYIRPALMRARAQFKHTETIQKGRGFLYDGQELIDWLYLLNE